MTAPRRWRIATSADDLQEGLFGQVLLWVFELLPALAARGVVPVWDIRSRRYGDAASGGLVLPGVFDPAPGMPGAPGEPPDAVDTGSLHWRARSLLSLRVANVSVLGGDWDALHALWHRFFRVPARVAAQADAFGLPARTLGLHYRGTDKNLAALDTNPVDADDFLRLARAFLDEHPGRFETVFVASDEPGFLAQAAAALAPVRVRGLGDVPFHKDPSADGLARADRALLDCVLLSRCAAVLKCSSALSGFAKVLRPELEIWRVAACKRFNDVPYFPDAHIPRLVLRDARAREILARQFAGDWLEDEEAASRWRAPFAARRRHGPWAVAVRALKYAVSVALGRPRRA